METALFKSSLSEVIKKLKEMLIKQGFMIENFDEHKMVVIAYRNGNWYRTPRHILFELSRVNHRLTRMDVTASIVGKKKSRQAEEVIEEKMVSVMYTNF